MKKQSFTSSLYTKTFFLLLTAASLGSLPAGAQTSLEKTGIENPAVVKYLGTAHNRSVFQVQLDNESGERFVVSIKDAEGNLLFQETYRDKKFDKKFLVETADAEPKLLFMIRNNKSIDQVFSVNRETRVIEDIVVTKL